MPRYSTKDTLRSVLEPVSIRDLRKTVSFDAVKKKEAEDDSEFEYYYSQTSSIVAPIRNKAKRIRKTKSESVLHEQSEDPDSDSGVQDHSTTTSDDAKALSPQRESPGAFKDESDQERPKSEPDEISGLENATLWVEGEAGYTYLTATTPSRSPSPQKTIRGPSSDKTDSSAKTNDDPPPPVRPSNRVDAQGRYPPAACIFVANLCQSQSDSNLINEVTKVFSLYGSVFVKIKRDKKRMPIAFCQFETANEADRALTNGNRRLILGRPCRTERCKANVTFIVCRRIKRDVTLDEAYRFMQRHGTVAKIELLDKRTQDFLGLRAQAFIVSFEFFDPRRNIEQLTCLKSEFFAIAFDAEEVNQIRLLDDGQNMIMEKYQRDLRSVFIGGLHEYTTEEWIRSATYAYRPVRSVQFKQTVVDDGKRVCFCFVEFADEFAPLAASNFLNGRNVEGRLLRCERKKFRLPSGPQRPAVAGPASQYPRSSVTGNAVPLALPAPMHGPSASHASHHSGSSVGGQAPSSSAVVKMRGASASYCQRSSVGDRTPASYSTTSLRGPSTSRYLRPSIRGHYPLTTAPQTPTPVRDPSGSHQRPSMEGQIQPLLAATQISGPATGVMGDLSGSYYLRPSIEGYLQPSFTNPMPSPSTTLWMHDLSASHYLGPSMEGCRHPSFNTMPLSGLATATPMRGVPTSHYQCLNMDGHPHPYFTANTMADQLTTIPVAGISTALNIQAPLTTPTSTYGYALDTTPGAPRRAFTSGAPIGDNTESSPAEPSTIRRSGRRVAFTDV